MGLSRTSWYSKYVWWVNFFTSWQTGSREKERDRGPVINLQSHSPSDPHLLASLNLFKFPGPLEIAPFARDQTFNM